MWDAATGEPLHTLQGHTDRVYAVAFSPDGKTLLSGSGDNTLRLWDAATGKSLLTLRGHTGRVTAVAYSPNGQTLLSGSGDNTLRLWDINDILTLSNLAADRTLVAKVSEALQFLWERSLEDIKFVHTSRRPSLFPIKGSYLTDAARYHNLLKPPNPGETKLVQVLRWAKKTLAEEGSKR